MVESIKLGFRPNQTRNLRTICITIGNMGVIKINPPEVHMEINRERNIVAGKFALPGKNKISEYYMLQHIVDNLPPEITGRFEIYACIRKQWGYMYYFTNSSNYANAHIFSGLQ